MPLLAFQQSEQKVLKATTLETVSFLKISVQLTGQFNMTVVMTVSQLPAGIHLTPIQPKKRPLLIPILIHMPIHTPQTTTQTHTMEETTLTHTTMVTIIATTIIHKKL